MSVPVVPAQYRSCGYQKLDGTSAAVGVTWSRNTPARLLCVTTTSDSVTWRDDGTDPTATDGMPLVNREMWYAACGNALKFYGGVVHVTLYEEV